MGVYRGLEETPGAGAGELGRGGSIPGRRDRGVRPFRSAPLRSEPIVVKNEIECNGLDSNDGRETQKWSTKKRDGSRTTFFARVGVRVKRTKKTRADPPSDLYMDDKGQAILYALTLLL